MKRNSPEYKIWILHRNEKNLKRRTRKKKAKKAALTRAIQYNTKAKAAPNYNVKEKRVEFKVPLNFSFIDNPEETVQFFNGIIRFITNSQNFGKRIYIDISRITNLTIDALMYLLAIVNNMNENFRNKFSFSGNEPSSPEICKLFKESGFYSFVKRIGNTPLSQNADTVQIVSGNNSNPEVPKQLIDFIISKTNLTKIDLKFLHVIMVELMANTHKHAYNNSVLLPSWYCFAEYKKDENKVAFTFMDTGEGIPSTVRKNFGEKLDILKLKGESKYVISALNGDFRTSTAMHYRGQGLPKVRKFCSDEKISDFRIITNKADVRCLPQDYRSSDMELPLRGTLFYWTINLEKLKGE